MTTRTTRRYLYSRWTGLLAAAMTVAAFALGYLIHPA
jgi:hypothetical protein